LPVAAVCLRAPVGQVADRACRDGNPARLYIQV